MTPESRIVKSETSIATQLLGKHIPAVSNQHATIEGAVFSVAPPRGYITRI